MHDTPGTEQVLLELRDASAATKRSYDGLIDLPQQVAALADITVDDRDIAVQHMANARDSLSVARWQLDAAYRALGGYSPDAPRRQ